MKVKRNTLLLLAALVWGIAGANILRIGLAAYPAYLTLWNTLLSVLVFAVFQQAVFGKLVKKHTARIHAYLEERHFFLKFFENLCVRRQNSEIIKKSCIIIDKNQTFKPRKFLIFRFKAIFNFLISFTRRLMLFQII